MKQTTTAPEKTTNLDPLTDFGFKKRFGSESNKDLLINFLNAVFQGRKEIVDLSYDKNDPPGVLKGDRTLIYDLICTEVTGAKFIIEMQAGRPNNFKARAFYYSCRKVAEQRAQTLCAASLAEE